jgi:hypothetical protein
MFAAPATILSKEDWPAALKHRVADQARFGVHNGFALRIQLGQHERKLASRALDQLSLVPLSSFRLGSAKPSSPPRTGECRRGAPRSPTLDSGSSCIRASLAVCRRWLVRRHVLFGK